MRPGFTSYRVGEFTTRPFTRMYNSHAGISAHTVKRKENRFEKIVVTFYNNDYFIAASLIVTNANMIEMHCGTMLRY